MAPGNCLHRQGIRIKDGEQSMSTAWKVSAAVRSGMGRVRKNNEDNYYFNGCYAELEAMDAETARQQVFEQDGSLFIVCDGMGGQNNGEKASYTVASQAAMLAEELQKADFNNAMKNWSQAVNQAVVDMTDGGGSTLALAYVKAGCVHVAHIGDSRVYRLHDGQLSRMTRDHSKVQMLMDAGLITAEQAKTHPHRHMITHFIGDEEMGGACQATIGRPMPAMQGDRYLLCSDGVTDMLDDEKLEKLMLAGNAEDCAEGIYQAALSAGGRDNTTLIVFELERGEGASDSDDPDDGKKHEPESEFDPLDDTEVPEVIVRQAAVDPAGSGTLRLVHSVASQKENNADVRIISEISGLPASVLQSPNVTFQTKTEIVRRHR